MRRTVGLVTLSLFLMGIVLPEAFAGDVGDRPLRTERAQARMYRNVVSFTISPGTIQVLDRLCRRGDPERACTPMTARLRNALERKLSDHNFDTVWVSEEQPDSGSWFWVFADVRWKKKNARFFLTYKETDPDGDCFGEGRYRFKWRQGKWLLADAEAGPCLP